MIRTSSILTLGGLAIAVALPVLAQSERDDFRTFEATEGDQFYFNDPSKLSQQGGEAVYNAVCSGCHMPEGEGAVGAGMYPALAENPNLEFPGYPIALIVNGQKAMPPLGGVLDDQQIADVTNYIRSHFGNDYVSGEDGIEATPEDVAAVRP